MKHIPILLLCLFAWMQMSCEEHVKPTEKAAVDLTEVKTILPDSAGFQIFQARCITCHSLRYIQMQPDMKRAGWQKIVEKMRKNFGAELSDAEAELIVDYLQSIKGKQ